jgi:hypothetical protein
VATWSKDTTQHVASIDPSATVAATNAAKHCNQFINKLPLESMVYAKLNWSH